MGKKVNITLYMDRDVIEILDEMARNCRDLPEKLGVDVEVKRKMVLSRAVVVECCLRYVWEKVLKRKVRIQY